MKHFWALPAALRLSVVLAAQRPFNVHDDLLAYPQYVVKWSEDYVTDAFATTKVPRLRSRSGQSSDSSHIDRYEPPPTTDHDPANGSNDDLDYEHVVLHKQRYLCAIPRIPPEEDEVPGPVNETTLAQKREEEARELARATQRGLELLQGMQGHCVYYVSGWWSYSFCFERSVKQFHALAPTRGMAMFPPQEDPGVEGFTLGTYDHKKDGQTGDSGVATMQDNIPGRPHMPRGELVAKGSTRYLVQRLEGGTICDLTGKGRKIEIQYHCNPNVGVDRISLIKELSTCAYLMIVQTPRLCNDVAFMPPQQDVPHDIVCRPILKPGEIDEYLSELATMKEAMERSNNFDASTVVSDLLSQEELPEGMSVEDLAELLANEASNVQIVGDVIVGGHSIVPEGTVLEKSAIVGGGKTTYIDTVADSDGKSLSQAELDKLGYGDARNVEKLAKDMKQMAQGRSWKLDVVDTPRGREYRGYIDEQAEEGESRKKPNSNAEPAQADDGDRQDGSQEEYFVKEEL